MLSNLSKKILATIVYYDVMDYPLTVFEIWKYLISDKISDYRIDRQAISDQEKNKKNFNLSEIAKELKKEELKKYIEQNQGFYFLQSREILIAERLKRNKISEEKFKKILKITKLIKYVPFVKMIAVAGRVAMKNAEQKSDLDIFIIFKKGKIFTGRFLVTTLVHILSKRRHGKKINNRICFNHFITDENEIFVRDLYSSHAYSFLMPVFGEDIFLSFYKKNEWIKNYRPNFEIGKGNLKIVRDTFSSKIIRNFLERVFSFDWLEKKMKNWQAKKIEKNPKTKKTGGVIICNDFELAFWPDFEKQGPRIFEKFQKKLQELDC